MSSFISRFSTVSSGQNRSKLTRKFYSKENPLQDKLGLQIDKDVFLDLLGSMIEQTELLQNKPPKLIPEESRITKIIKEFLLPYTVEEGGVLELSVIEYVAGRANMIIKYPGKMPNSSPIGLIGCHLDVVPADPKTWDYDPFRLTIVGDRLYGRGTTDCLDHCALVSCLFREMALKRIELNSDIIAVFIANEESIETPGVGIDALAKDGLLNQLKIGTSLWIDASDSEPCMGTAGYATWRLRATAKRFHSGLPHKAINPVELVSDALIYIQSRFYSDFPYTEEEKKYQYEIGCTMKPTQITCDNGSPNQIPSYAEVSGDIRITPFHDISHVKAKISDYAKDLQENRFQQLPTRGDFSKYYLDSSNIKAKLDLTWEGDYLNGFACDIDSLGFQTLQEAIRSVKGEVKPYSITGSLPLVRDMQDKGFEIHITGFGLGNVYHGDNEYCLLSDMTEAARILSYFISGMDETTT